MELLHAITKLLGVPSVAHMLQVADSCSTSQDEKLSCAWRADVWFPCYFQPLVKSGA